MKKHWLAFIAIVIAISAVAFTKPEHKLKNTTYPLWYFTEDMPDNQGDRTKYEPLTSQDVDLCSGSGETNCVIEAPEHQTSGQGDNTPDLSNPGLVDIISFKPE